MRRDIAASQTLILGLGNILLSDDGVGVHVLRALEQMARQGEIGQAVAFRDGGTIGLALLSEIEVFDALIVVDAMEMNEPQGYTRLYQGPAMDAQLGGKKRTAHEVALADLIMAAELAGCAPERRALVAIQPGTVGWGLSAGPAVEAAIPTACKMVQAVLEEWNHAC